MISRAVRAKVLARSGQRCERCGRWLDVDAGSYSLQHRRSRGMGGSRLSDTDAAVNLSPMCGSATTPGGCHQFVESHPLEALEDGWRVRQGDDPAAVPIRHHELGLVLLTDNFAYEDVAAAYSVKLTGDA